MYFKQPCYFNMHLQIWQTVTVSFWWEFSLHIRFDVSVDNSLWFSLRSQTVSNSLFLRWQNKFFLKRQYFYCHAGKIIQVTWKVLLRNIHFLIRLGDFMILWMAKFAILPIWKFDITSRIAMIEKKEFLFW